jgi:RNase P subunit RPR2
VDFNHDTQSRFKLVGSHKKVSCKKCHPGGQYRPLDMACKACHAEDSPHEGNPQFKDKPCDDCHSPRDWTRVKFDHNNLTRFALTGAHQEVDCEKCHPGKDFDRKIPASCDGCHIDLHKGQMQPKLCGNCHTFDGWTIPNFQHNEQSRFSLVGEHMEVACNKCHVAGHFKPIQASCATCHRDFHKGQMADRICEECHSPLGWQKTSFVHNRDSDYRLRGQHVTIDCKKCHTRNNYRGLPKDCSGCHTDYHRGQRGPSCSDCHTETGWDTNTAQVHFFGAYRLAGEHDRIPCDTCHISGRELGGLGHECVNCHRDPHFSSFGPFCIDCHGQNAWLPSRFRHFQTGFRLTGAHRFVRCESCHINRIFGGLPTDCIFCHQDSAMRFSTVEPGHSCYNAADCSVCHVTLGFTRVRGAFRGALEECMQ